MLEVDNLQSLGFDDDQINQILKIYEEVNIDMRNLPISVPADEIRVLRKKLFDNKFTPIQESYLVEGLENKVNIMLYANPAYSAEKMFVILNALKDNLDIKDYIDMYNIEDGNTRVNDLSLIFEGIKAHLDVSKYMSPDFSYEQKVQIKKGIESKVNVDIYANPKYTADQMNSLFKALRANIDTTKWANEKYCYVKMELIRSCLEQDLDITQYIDTDFTIEQIDQIKKGLERGIDVSIFANKDFSPVKMRAIRKTLEYNKTNNEHLPYEVYLKDISDEEVLRIKAESKNANRKHSHDMER